MTLIQRGGASRSFHVDGTTAKDLLPIIKASVAANARIMTDEAGQYAHLNEHFDGYKFVRHSAEEYVRGDAHTSTVEGFYSVFKRGIKGVYRHCGEQHLLRHVTEFDFRHCNRAGFGVTDQQRTDKALMGVKGERLTYGATKRQMASG